MKWLVLVAIYAFGFTRLAAAGRWGELVLSGGVVAVLAAFLFGSAFLRRSATGEDILIRTQTWCWMIAIFLLAATTHRVVPFVLLGFLSFVGLREYFSLLPMYRAEEVLRPSDRAAIALAYLTIPLVYGLAYSGWYGLYIILIPVYASLALPVVLVLANNPRGILTSMGTIMCGMSLFVFFFSHAALLAQLSPILLFYALVVTEARDVLAYCVGKLIGPLPYGWVRAAVASNINPRKTWAASAVAAFACGLLSATLAPLMPELPGGRPSPQYLFWLGLGVGWLGLAGDLATGGIKRDLHVKDTGHSLPGHGGVIDRINGVVFTVPVIFHITYYRYFPGPLRL
jgi:phosphatidate cytidylyltransferase